MDRILILTAVERWQDASSCLAGAACNAAIIKRVSFGLVMREEPSPADLAEMRVLGSVQYLVSEENALQCFSLLWQGESHTLLIDRNAVFSAGWDLTLLRMLHRLEKNGSAHPVLTGIPPLTDAVVDAFRSVALERITGPDGTMFFRAGTPVRLSREPVQTAFLSLFFCFSTSAFFRLLEKKTGSLSVHAFVNGWDLFVPCLCPCHTLVPFFPPAEDIRDAAGDSWQRFARRAGISEHFPYLNGQARTGILSSDLGWETSIPLRERLLDRIRFLCDSGSGISLLCVSAVLSEPVHPENTPEENSACLRWLSSLREPPMLFLTDAVTRPTVQLKHPNVSDFSPSAGLPLYRRLQSLEDPDWLRLSRMFFLRFSRERNPGHTHYAWLDPCAVNYPVDPDTVPDLKPFCTERITIATVNGEPDFSMIIVPDNLVAPLCGEISALCEESCRKPIPFPAPSDIWKDLLERFPSRFTLVPLPEKNGLIAHILRVSANNSCVKK